MRSSRGKQAGALGLVVLSDAAGILAQHRQAHGDVEPVQHVLGFRGDQFRQSAHLLAAVGQEGDVLVRLQALALQHLEQPTLRFPIVAVHQAEVARRPIFGHRAADDELEIALSVVPVADIAAVEGRHDAAFRDRQLLPLGRTAVDEAGPLLAQLGLGALGDTQDVLAHGGGVRTGRDRQHVGEQPGRGGVGHERRPAGLQIEPLRGDMAGDQSRAAATWSPDRSVPWHGQRCSRGLASCTSP